MISVSQMREQLGTAADPLIDEQIEKLRNIQYQLADIVFESWVRQWKGTLPSSGDTESRTHSLLATTKLIS